MKKKANIYLIKIKKQKNSFLLILNINKNIVPLFNSFKPSEGGPKIFGWFGSELVKFGKNC